MDDMNHLIGLANQMDLVHGFFEQAVSNASKCGTWQDIQASHQAENDRVVLSFKNIYGMLALLAIGLTGALIMLLLEGCFLCLSSRCLNNSPQRLAWRRGRKNPAPRVVVV